LPSVSLNVANLNICFNIINLFARSQKEEEEAQERKGKKGREINKYV